MTSSRSTFSLVFLAFMAAGACATHTTATSKTGHKKGTTCDVFANPCPPEQACIDAACRPKACAGDADCHGGSCLQGWCIVAECRENQSCLGADDTAGTADDGSCIGAVCMPITCLRDPKHCPAKGGDRCSWNADCGSGFICSDGACTQARCLADRECLPKMCFNGVCLDAQCDENRPCAAGKTCVSGLCLTTAASSK